MVRSHAFLFIGDVKIGHSSFKTQSGAREVWVECGSWTSTHPHFITFLLPDLGNSAGGVKLDDPHFNIQAQFHLLGLGKSTGGLRLADPQLTALYLLFMNQVPDLIWSAGGVRLRSVLLELLATIYPSFCPFLPLFIRKSCSKLLTT